MTGDERKRGQETGRRDCIRGVEGREMGKLKVERDEKLGGRSKEG